MSSSLPTKQGKSALDANASVLSPDEKRVADLLVSNDQAHVFAEWPQPGTADADKKRFLHQCAAIEHDYLGGISTYVRRARELLRLAAVGGNPYATYDVSEPTDSARIDNADQIRHYERIGMSAIAKSAFVIVAGGLGERLGYVGIKLALPSETATETTFIELYIRYILALQARARVSTGNTSLRLPFVIMTSDDTDKLTRELLNEHDNFGMPADQLFIIKQGKVPSLQDDQAHFVLEEKDKFALDTKPHGHGDVHVLLYQSGLVRKFVHDFDTKHVVFFQDTNGLVFHALVAGLGVSVEKNLEVNSLTVPRVQGDAVGAICKLQRNPAKAAESEGKETEKLADTLTISVEYNQLEGLLGKGVKEPTVAGTNISVYPGNINVLIFDAPAYLSVLEDKKGVISEFVNPKYNADKKTFKKPTRLECMMQDYAKLLDASAKVGFSQFERWTSFSAVKNALADGAQKQKDGNAPEAATTGEMEIYQWFARVLGEAGVDVAKPYKQTFGGITVDVPPKIVLLPAFGVTREEIVGKFPTPADVHLTKDSALVLDGDAIIVAKLNVKGALIVTAVSGAHVRIDGLNVDNAGYSFTPLKGDENVKQKYAVRGFIQTKTAADVYHFTKPGHYVLSDSTASQFKLK